MRETFILALEFRRTTFEERLRLRSRTIARMDGEGRRIKGVVCLALSDSLSKLYITCVFEAFFNYLQDNKLAMVKYAYSSMMGYEQVFKYKSRCKRRFFQSRYCIFNGNSNRYWYISNT